MQIPTGGAATIAALFLTVCCAATLLAQSSDAAAGSLGELTAEIRQLRFAIEQSSRTQTQAQAIGIFLSAQQSRILQVTAWRRSKSRSSRYPTNTSARPWKTEVDT